jgi:hypothetical protein
MHGLVFLIALLAATSHALPDHVQSLQTRQIGTCIDNQRGPCICGQSRGIRDEEAFLHCGTAAYQFTNRVDPRDGTVLLVSYCFLNRVRHFNLVMQVNIEEAKFQCGTPSSPSIFAAWQTSDVFFGVPDQSVISRYCHINVTNIYLVLWSCKSLRMQ